MSLDQSKYYMLHSSHPGECPTFNPHFQYLTVVTEFKKTALFKVLTVYLDKGIVLCYLFSIQSLISFGSQVKCTYIDGG